jgi:hypothetical protein
MKMLLIISVHFLVLFYCTEIRLLVVDHKRAQVQPVRGLVVFWRPTLRNGSWPVTF